MTFLMAAAAVRLFLGRLIIAFFFKFSREIPPM
jgi:hypothetical protein